MNKIKITILSICFLAACNNIKKEDKNSSKANPLTEPKSCYSFNNGKDSINMSIEINNNEAKGNLNFHYYEKDANIGTFSGNLSGDTLWANYTFLSEGTQSNREIVFLKDGDKWIQGYGEVIENNKGFAFVNHDDIRFDNNFILEKVDCNP
jgi:hypothetical protein